MKNFDKDKFVKSIIMTATILLVVGVLVVTALIITNVLIYKIGNFANLCIIMVISWLNFYVQLLSHKYKFNFAVIFMLVFSIILTIMVITNTILIIV